MLLSRLFFYEKFRSLNNYALICRLNEEKHKPKIRNYHPIHD